jgi:DNA-binding response OmpR family regulator
VDLIISDWDMPGFSGIDLIRGLKANPRTRHIPIVIVTGVMLTSKDLDIALTEGAFDYIRKPIDPVELAARVNSALQISFCHARELEQKNIELAEKTLILIRNNEFNIEMAGRLRNLLEIFEHKKEAQELIYTLIDEIEQKIHQDTWQDFELAFQNVHTDFIRNIISKYPELTPGELRLAILIKLGMNIKDMASLLYQSPSSLKVARSRLRKKFRIGNDVNFSSFLAAF